MRPRKKDCSTCHIPFSLSSPWFTNNPYTHAFLSKLSPFISKTFTTLLFPTPPPIIEQPRNISRQKYTPVERKKRRLRRERRAKSSRKWRDRDTGRSSTNFESGAGAQMKNGHPINPSWSRASTKDLRCRSQFARSSILLPARFSSWDINASQPQYTPPPLSLSLLLHHLRTISIPDAGDAASPTNLSVQSLARSAHISSACVSGVRRINRSGPICGRSKFYHGLYAISC